MNPPVQTTKEPSGKTGEKPLRTINQRLARAWRVPLQPLRRIPRAGLACCVIAFLNAVIWGVVVPPFQVPDEPEHFAYAQYLAETGRPPPQGSGPAFSPQEAAAVNGLLLPQVIGNAHVRGVLTSAQDQALRSDLAHQSPIGTGGVSNVTNQPPLYYALAAIPYWLSPSHDLLARLAAMRLLSALLAAGTVLAIFMFLRELLPTARWAWTVGALVVAFQPTFMFIASGVQGDNLLFFTSALTLLLLVRAYRRGLTQRRAAAIGGAIAAGLLAKLTFIGLIPGIALAVLLLTWRARTEGRRRALVMLATAAAVAALPVALYAVANTALWHRGGPTAGGLGGVTGSVHGVGPVSWVETLEYTWEFYFPRLPFMGHNFFPGQHPAVSTWIDGTIGRFGWLDYGFPAWVYTVGRVIAAGLIVLAFVSLVRRRARVTPLLPLFGCFAVMALGLLAAIAVAGIRYRLSTGYAFEQARYLFPLLPLYGLLIVLAAASPGRRWAPALGAGLVILAMVHGLFAETLTISRYYG